MNRLRCSVGWSCVALLLLFFPLDGFAQDVIRPGDYAVVTCERAAFGLKDQAYDPLSRGRVLWVTEVRAPWIGGVLLKSDPAQRGWVAAGDVARLSEPEENQAQVASLAQAIDRWARVGAKVYLNGEGKVHAIDASNLSLPDAAFVTCSLFTSVVSFDAGGNPLTDEGLKSLVQMPRLERLYVDHTSITDEGLKLLPPLSRLEVLVLSHCPITGDGLAEIKRLSTLRTLNLKGCAIKDEDLAPIASLGDLEVLVLAKTQIAGPGLEFVGDLDRLRVLNLNDTNVDDASLTHLEGMPSLRMLYVRNTKVTKKGVDQLDPTLNSCAIYRR